MKRFKKFLLFSVWMLLLPLHLWGQSYFKFTQAYQNKSSENMPSYYEEYSFNAEGLKTFLKNAPDLRASARGMRISLPTLHGKQLTFDVYRVHPMHPDLERRFPYLLSFKGINKEGYRLRMDLNSRGVFYTIYTPRGERFIFRATSAASGILYLHGTMPRPANHVCEVTEQNILDNLARPSSVEVFNDGLHRKYRLAFAADGEYSQYHINLAIQNGTLSSNASDAEKKQVVLEALVTVVNRVNEIYETDMAITLELVPNNLDIIFLDPDNDPYSNDSGSLLLTQNQTTLDDIIGASNYDIGHVATTGGGGLARLGSVCRDGVKAMGETGLDNPIGDEYAVDFVAHEMGHQFGANHTFANYCGGNRNDETAVEPGSGSTIMGYAGVCAPNVQLHSDPQFHFVSLDEIWAHVTQYTCAQTEAVDNAPPVVEAGPGKYIPRKTPFVLTAVATDDNSSLTYTWDETDALLDGGTENAPPDENNTSGPMFRVYPYQPENFRYFPRMRDILSGDYGNTWEVLPNVSRTLRFKVVVRDHAVPGAQIGVDGIILGVDASTGPFRVTSHSEPMELQPGDNLNITWDVAGTTGGNVNCSTVDILFSVDGGRTFTDTLAANIPNNGSATVQIPDDISTCLGIYMVKAHDNYFFDVNKGKIKINCECGTQYSVSPGLTIPDDDPTGIISTLIIEDEYPVSGVKVPIDITHSYVSDLVISLISPEGTEVTLFNQNCSNEQDLNIIFDDDGAPMDCNQLNQGLHFIPVTPLSTLDGENIRGEWKLKVTDRAGGDVGVLNSWGLITCLGLEADSENLLSQLSIYPVPATDAIHIRFDARSKEQQILITDLNGRIMVADTFNETGQTDLKYDVSQWAEGIYIVTVTDGDMKSVRKIIVK